MSVVVYVLSGLLAFGGLMFIVGAQGEMMRLIVGLVLIAASGVMVYLTRVQPKKQEITHVQKIDLSGDVQLEQMKCKSCNGALSKENVVVKAGAVFIECPYCGAAYQIEEAPKW